MYGIIFKRENPKEMKRLLLNVIIGCLSPCSRLTRTNLLECACNEYIFNNVKYKKKLYVTVILTDIS